MAEAAPADIPSPSDPPTSKRPRPDTETQIPEEEEEVVESSKKSQKKKPKLRVLLAIIHDTFEYDRFIMHLSPESVAVLNKPYENARESMRALMATEDEEAWRLYVEKEDMGDVDGSEELLDQWLCDMDERGSKSAEVWSSPELFAGLKSGPFDAVFTWIDGPDD